MDFQPSSTYRAMRSSLYPFIRNHNPILDQLEAISQRSNIQDSSKHKPRLKLHLLQRYHDQAYIVKQKQLTNIQKYVKLLNRISRVFQPSNNTSNNLKQNNQKWLEQSRTINPQSNILYAWNFIMILSILYHLFQMPIALFFTEQAFTAQFTSGFGITCNAISLLVFFLNIVYVIPNTQYYHNGFLVTNHEKIISRYIGWRLWIDISSFVFIFVYAVANVYALIYMKLCSHLILYRLAKVDDSLQRKIQLTKIRLAVYKLTRLIILLLYLVLWLSAIFFAIDYYYYQQGQNSLYQGTYLWLSDSATANDIDLIQTYDWHIWLNYSAYWCLQTVSMVGFGDLTAKNPVQAVYVSIVITCIVIFYAFFITGVWDIVAQATQFSQYQNKQWKIYKQYQRQNMKPLDKKKQALQKGIKYRQLKNKVGSYLFQMWSYQKAYSQINIVQILQKSLTPQLKDQVFVNYRQHLFQRIDLFGILQKNQAKMYKQIFRQLIFKITQQKYAKSQYVLNKGQLSYNLIYLVNGTLTMQYPNSNYRRTFFHSFSDLKHKEDTYIDNQNYNFGVKYFFIQQRLPYSVYAESFCKTSELSYDDFIKSIKQSDEFYSNYCELRDKLKLQNTDSLAGQQCIECQSPQHELSLCEQSDITMNYKRYWMMKIAISGNKIKKQQNNDKSSKIPYKRKTRKSKKIHNLEYTRVMNIQLDRIKSYKNYFQEHNL